MEIQLNIDLYNKKRFVILKKFPCRLNVGDEIIGRNILNSTHNIDKSSYIPNKIFDRITSGVFLVKKVMFDKINDCEIHQRAFLIEL